MVRDGAVILCRAGRADKSRAEDLLESIDALLKNAGMDKTALDLIAVSNGPGSYTGIRIGAATALGLSRALGISCSGVSLFDAIARVSEVSGRFAVAVLVRKDEVSWQVFEKTEQSLRSVEDPATDSPEKFAEFVEASSVGDIVATASFPVRLTSTPAAVRGFHVLEYSSCLAYYIAASAEGFKDEAPRPLYLNRFSGGRGYY